MILINGTEIKQNHFCSGELKVQFPFITPNSVSINVEWRYENDGELFTLACIREHYRNHPCYLEMLYLPHARMDRVKSEEDVFTLKTFCNMINAIKFDRVCVEDAHSNVSLALLDNVINFTPKVHINRILTAYPDTILFFPDEGAMKRYSAMFPNFKYAFGIKKRNWETMMIEGYMIVGEENVKDKNILIIDDICSYGNTFVKCAVALKEAGAKNIDLYITHCEDVISKGDVFTCGNINTVYTTRSLIHSKETAEKVIYV